MNSRERFLATMTFQETDRVPLWEVSYWADTIRRWYKEGLPKVSDIPDEYVGSVSIMGEARGVLLDRTPDHDVHDYFKLDKGRVLLPLNVGAYPSFEHKIIEDHGDWYIWQSPDGYLMKESKSRSSLPSIINAPVKTREDWECYKQKD